MPPLFGLAPGGVYPAIDVVASCTRELQRLKGEERMLEGQALADSLVATEDNVSGSAIDWVLDQIQSTRTNQEILSNLANRKSSSDTQ